MQLLCHPFNSLMKLLNVCRSVEDQLSPLVFEECAIAFLHILENTNHPQNPYSLRDRITKQRGNNALIFFRRIGLKADGPAHPHEGISQGSAVQADITGDNVLCRNTGLKRCPGKAKRSCAGDDHLQRRQLPEDFGRIAPRGCARDAPK